MRSHTKPFSILIGVFCLAAASLACSLGGAAPSGPSENDLVATQNVLQATQLALQSIQLQATQAALAAQQAAQTTLPPAAPVEQATQPPAPDVSFDGVSLSFDPVLGREVSTRIVPADPIEDIYWGAPEHTQLEFMGYPVENDYHEPQVKIFPTDAFRARNEGAGEIIDRLRSMLDSRPADSTAGLPFLPIYNAGQLGHARFEYLDFQNGSGVRFVTQLGQAFWPLNNQALFYTFQGLTADGRYYVSVILPVTHPLLNEFDDYQPPQNFYEIEEELLRGLVLSLNGQPDDSFAPSLAVMDAMVRSIRVEK